MRDYEYYRRIFAPLRKPLAYVDLDLLDENIRLIAERAAVYGKRVRVASKSVRCTAVLRRIFAASDVFQGIMAFTAAEAVYLAKEGFDDILIGYPVCDPDGIAEIICLTTTGHCITFMVDSAEHLRHISRIAAEQGPEATARVCIDVDMSTEFPGLHFGVRRSPLKTAADLAPLLDELRAQKAHVRLAATGTDSLAAGSGSGSGRVSLILDGIMGYEAQIAGVGDNVPSQAIKSRTVRWLKGRSVPQIAARRKAVFDAIAKAGFSLRFVNGGGTGSLHTTGREEVVTEITVGSGFYSPGLFDNYEAFRYQPAAGFAIQVVRRPRSDMVTCAGGGYVASGSPGWDKVPKPYLPEGLKLLPNEAAGEVQTPFTYSGSATLSLGDPVLMRHAKAGELCERFPVLYAVSNGEIVDTYKTYRGDGQCFL